MARKECFSITVCYSTGHRARFLKFLMDSWMVQGRFRRGFPVQR